MVNEKKQGRNELCSCGSGKKYKKCCLMNKDKSEGQLISSSIDKEINEAAELSIEHNADTILTAINNFKRLLTRPNLTLIQKKNVIIGLTIAYQHRGEHNLALATLDTLKEFISCYDNKDIILTKTLAARSYREIGYHELSTRIFSEALSDIDKLGYDEGAAAFVNVEAGKSFYISGDTNRAKESWEKAINYFSKNKEHEMEHYARTQANIAYLLLEDNDKAKQQDGVKLIEESSILKLRIGDLEGLANNYCNLGLYYFKTKRYEKAIAYLRKDLYLTREIGDLCALGTTLNNLASLYIECLQLNAARELLREASELADRTNNENLRTIVENSLKAVNEKGKCAGQSKQRIGPTAYCACNSGKIYRECCGRADFDPVDFAYQYGDISQDIQSIISEAKNDGIAGW